MKITFLGNIRTQLVIAVVLTILFGILSYNTTDNIYVTALLNFFSFFIFGVVVTTLTPRQILFLVPFAMLSSVIYLNSVPSDMPVIDSIFFSTVYFMVIYGIFFLLYDFWKNKNVNMSVIIAAILYFITMIIFT